MPSFRGRNSSSALRSRRRSLAGCKKSDAPAQKTADGRTHIKVGYIGITCEAPIFTAVEKGFFKDEGLEVELVKCEWSKYKDVLALGGFDITHHLIMYFLKPIEQGLDVKFTAGIHRGCLRVQGPVGRGAARQSRICAGNGSAVPGMGTPPFIFANRVLGANGIDARKDVEWRVFPAGELGLALEKGRGRCHRRLRADRHAAARGRQSAQHRRPGEGRAVQRGILLRGDREWQVPAQRIPTASAAATRALLKGAKWVETNPARRGAHVGGEEISRLESRAEHHGDRQPALHPERHRREGSRQLPPPRK